MELLQPGGNLDNIVCLRKRAIHKAYYVAKVISNLSPTGDNVVLPKLPSTSFAVDAGGKKTIQKLPAQIH